MKELVQLIKKHHLKNRTIVSKDVLPFLEEIGKACGAKLKLHRFKTGRDIATWVVPERWDVREAWLKGPDGRIIASYKDHPLFVAPYSKPFSGTLPLAELKKHIRCHPTQKDAFFYEHRLAYDYRRRLKEWIITLPQRVFDSLKEGRYEVKLDLEIASGEMLVGELTLKGSSRDRIALLADYCHPGQVNDSLSGLMAMIEVFRRLRQIPGRKFTYSLFLFPETIGSSVLLASQPALRKLIRAAILSEFVAWGERWVVSASPGIDSLACKLAAESRIHWGDIQVVDLFEGWGNDEYVFHYAGIPSLAVQKFDCPEYHSSNDEPGRIRLSEVARAADIIFRMCRIIDSDRVYAPVHPVPFYLSRFNLYLDAVDQRIAFKERRKIIYGLNGRDSLLDIAVKNGVSFDTVKELAERLAELKLLQKPARRSADRTR